VTDGWTDRQTDRQTSFDSKDHAYAERRTGNKMKTVTQQDRH